ncbi:type VI secretion system baseplate subunit TssF [Salmonirosea aquatica]|uniref:Type VI secretion system baseplate subunit TssF n=1 Tax=Salmonirosea aquatica TaxID=2654236 RepID=A0A7C9FT10_9BACT|nr:hypothetical protein [Cytophagaceae bacterium SJW1-29]
MPIVENRASIKQRLRAEAARQWGLDENDLKNGSFDPLVDLLFGAFAVETEKVWHELEVARSRVVKRMVETVLPEVITGILPAHTVLMARPVTGPAEVQPRDQFLAAGSDSAVFSSAGTFELSGATLQYIATGSRIDKVGAGSSRETVIRLNGGKSVGAYTVWIGIEPPTVGEVDSLVLFLNWSALAERARFLSYTASVKFFYGRDASLARLPIPVSVRQGIYSTSDASGPQAGYMARYEETVQNFYAPHFVTLDHLPLTDKRQLKKYPEAWEGTLEPAEKALFQQELFWLKMVAPAALTPEALDRLEIATNCFPAVNRKLVRQRGKLQPLFNVFALTEESGFLAIDRVMNGDGEELTPVGQHSPLSGDNVYSLRKRNVARFDHRDAFEKLTDVTHHLRDDLAAFNALDNSILTTHLDTINRGITKLREHLDTFTHQLPLLHILVRTRSQGSVLDVHFWSSLGSRGNGLAAQTKLKPEPTNQLKTDAALLMVPSSGGRDPLDEGQMQGAFREAILTRGKAVTVEDFRTIARSVLGDSAERVTVRKNLSIGEGAREGVRLVLEVGIVPIPSQKQTEEFWLKQAQLVKNKLEQCSTGVLPLFVQVEGFSWKV